MRYSQPGLFLWALILCLASRQGWTQEEKSIARVSIYNPTAWDGQTVVEIPTGRFATPGLVDWSNVRLVRAGKEIPFAIREGRAHWKARLAAPVESPRAEDLMVFSCAAPTGAWTEFDLLPGKASVSSALENDNGKLTVKYANVEVVVDEKTGLLRRLSAFGESLLKEPHAITAYELADEGHTFEGHFGPGYSDPRIVIHKKAPTTYKARLFSSASTPAMTELHFILEVLDGPTLALTYRVHSSGIVEIWADGRPHKGRSPWSDRAIEYRLALQGEGQVLPYFENRMGFYGFKHFMATMKFTGSLHTGGPVGLLELGEESINGRRWMRKLFPFSREREKDTGALVELADEGLLVVVTPKQTAALRDPVEVTAPGAARIAGEKLVSVLSERGLNARLVSSPSGSNPIRLELFNSAGPQGIEDDGFAIRPSPTSGLSIRAGTTLGLYKAVKDIAGHFVQHEGSKSLPLIARNPVVGFRGIGIGGGNAEVDFPYADTAEWERVFENFIDSGINVVSCLSMWGNWKMPVDYRLLPELQTDSGDAYDQSSGTFFREIAPHRENGIKLAEFLRDRGARVWLEIMIGVVPGTFADKFPDAIAPGSHGEFWGHPNAAPCFSHAHYQRYLDAFVGEILDTYPLDGLWFARDDNGELCSCDRCKTFIENSRTKDPVWEQHLLLYDWLRDHGFEGEIGVYPYLDRYDAKVEPLLPDDLYIVGHGGGAAALFRDYETIGFMPDTWLDNPYLFRLAPSPRMRRLLSDRGCFWVGGAYVGCELTWESVGFFGFEPTGTPNTLRQQLGAREFGVNNALAYVRLTNALEHLWEIEARYLLPREWMKLNDAQREAVFKEGLEGLEDYRSALAAFKDAVDQERHDNWLRNVSVYSPFFDYALRRAHHLGHVHDLAVEHREQLHDIKGLPDDVLADMTTRYKETFALEKAYFDALKDSEVEMLKHTWIPKAPVHDWYFGYDGWIEPQLKIPRFAGDMMVLIDGQGAGQEVLRVGQQFVFSIELSNRGISPWIPGVGHRVEISGVSEALGLAATSEHPEAWTMPGGRMAIARTGKVPEEPGKGELKVTFLAPARGRKVLVEKTFELSWK